jgi:hypothetical protein
MNNREPQQQTMTTEEHNSTGETTTDAHRSSDDSDLARKLSEIRYEINGRAAAADAKQEEELYRIFYHRLTKTERHLEAMRVAQDPQSEFSFEQILDELDEELVPAGNGATLETSDES